MDANTAAMDEQLRAEQEYWTERLRQARREHLATQIIKRNLDNIRAQRDQLLAGLDRIA